MKKGNSRKNTRRKRKMAKESKVLEFPVNKVRQVASTGELKEPEEKPSGKYGFYRIGEEELHPTGVFTVYLDDGTPFEKDFNLKPIVKGTDKQKWVAKRMRDTALFAPDGFINKMLDEYEVTFRNKADLEIKESFPENMIQFLCSVGSAPWWFSNYEKVKDFEQYCKDIAEQYEMEVLIEPRV